MARSSRNGPPKGHRLYPQQDIDLINWVLELLDKGIPISQVKRRLEGAERTAHGAAEPSPWEQYQQRMVDAVARSAIATPSCGRAPSPSAATLPTRCGSWRSGREPAATEAPVMSLSTLWLRRDPRRADQEALTAARDTLNSRAGDQES